METIGVTQPMKRVAENLEARTVCVASVCGRQVSRICHELSRTAIRIRGRSFTRITVEIAALMVVLPSKNSKDAEDGQEAIDGG